MRGVCIMPAQRDQRFLSNGLRCGLFQLFSAIASICLIISCTRQVEFPVMDYNDSKKTKFPEWECHQVFSMEKDAGTGEKFLKVTAYPLKKYPGILLPWLSGNWSGYKSLCIEARMDGSRANVFFLSIWDGKGDYIPGNRWAKKVVIDSVWKEFVFPLADIRLTSNGDIINLRHIELVTFFTRKQNDTTVFDVKKIALQR
jgi:hypothetical protein